ncbi:MAG: NUDIX domain-containing protein [Alphaproteobacteria bacterium]
MPSPVTPRPSASLILLRDTADIPCVLMGTRHRSMRFMPGYLVFPGGTVDQEDIDIAGGLAVHPNTKPGLSRNAVIEDGRAYLWTAIRETAEETGLLLGNEGDWDVETDEPTAHRFREATITPATEKLGLVGRAITPESSPIRFDALFFLARGETMTGDITPNDELEDVAWLRVDLALAADEMADVTRFMLTRALIAWSQRRPFEPVDIAVPTYTYDASETPILRHEDARIERLRDAASD